MKSKVLLSIFVILLILVGCGFNFLDGEPEWMRAEDSVYLYWQAITNRQYELAKYYCIPNGVWYNKVDELEEYINDNSEDGTSLLISSPYFYNQTEVIGNNAITYVKIFVDIITFSNGYPVFEGEILKYEIELIKISPPGDWKLK